MSAVDVGPAPTLLNDWVTTDAFLAIIGFAAFAVVVWMATEFLKRMHAASAEIDRVLAEGPPAYNDTCCIQKCTRPGVVPFNTPGGVLFACRQCAGIVGQWVGHDNRVYDQDLDQTTDLGQWNKEMDAS